MKYHLDTIPVWDAYREETECPLCVLNDKLEKSYVESFLGGSVMEPNMRVEVNKTGFCPHHNKLLYDSQNHLGLALITHTYMIETNKKLKDKTKKVQKCFRRTSNANPFKKALGKESDKLTDDLSNFLKKHVNSCMICDRIENSINRYAYTILYLWDHDNEFKKLFLNSKGFCFSHLATMIDLAVENLSRQKQENFSSDILTLQIKNMERLEEELKWFTLKFDYKNQEKSWKNSKDALPRSLQKLTGKYMDD